MIYPTYTRPGVNANLLELSRSRSRAIKWKHIEQQAQRHGHQHIAAYAQRLLLTEQHLQYVTITRLISIASGDRA